MAQLYDGEPRRGRPRLDPELLSDIRRHLAAATRPTASPTPARKPPKRRVTAPGRHAERERRPRPVIDEEDAERRDASPSGGRVREEPPRAASSRTKGDSARSNAKSASKPSSSGVSSKGSSSSSGKPRSDNSSKAAAVRKSEKADAPTSSRSNPTTPSSQRSRRTRESSPRQEHSAEERGVQGRPRSKRTPSPPEEAADENVAVHANSSRQAAGSSHAAPRRRHTTSVTSPRRAAASDGSADGCAAWCGAQPHDRAAPCCFLLNQASEEHMYAFFQQAPRLGLRTAHRVLSAREEGGPYFSGADFDRRLARITYARLLASAEAVGAKISLDMDVQPMGSRDEAGCSVVATMVTAVGGGADGARSGRTKSLLRVASWNAGHFSLGSRFVKEKTSNLVRFIRSDRPHIVALQEVYAGVPTHLARCLTKASRARWRCVGDVDTSEGGEGGALRQAFLYDSTQIYGADLTPDIPGDVMAGFLRPPCVAAFDVGGELVALVNVHLSTRFKEGEVRLLPPLVRALRAMVAERGGDERAVILVGDYNVASDAQVFDGLRDVGLIEIVRPPNAGVGVKDDHFLTSCTTVGGEYFDNLWLHSALRKRVGGAWVWQFGGRGQGLGTTASAHAGSRRAKRSDHYVLVTELEVGEE